MEYNYDDEIINNSIDKIRNYISKRIMLNLGNETFGVVFDKELKYYNDICLMHIENINNNSYKVPDFVTIIGKNNLKCVHSLLLIDKDGIKTDENANFRGKMDDSVFANKKFDTVNIGNNTRIISDNSFLNSLINRIEIKSNNIEYIGMWAFSDNKELKYFDFEMLKDTIIMRGCFSGCEKLESADLTNVILEGDSTFSSCFNLSEIKLPTRIKYIEEFSFCGSAIKEITIPDNVEILHSYCFSNCKELKNINIGTSLHSLESYSFKLETVFKKEKYETILNIKSNKIYGSNIDINAFYGRDIIEINASKKVKETILNSIKHTRW